MNEMHPCQLYYVATLCTVVRQIPSHRMKRIGAHYISHQVLENF